MTEKEKEYESFNIKEKIRKLKEEMLENKQHFKQASEPKQPIKY